MKTEHAVAITVPIVVGIVLSMFVVGAVNHIENVAVKNDEVPVTLPTTVPLPASSATTASAPPERWTYRQSASQGTQVRMLNIDRCQYEVECYPTVCTVAVKAPTIEGGTEEIQNALAAYRLCTKLGMAPAMDVLLRQ